MSDNKTMKATHDLKKAGITEAHAEAISATLHEVVDNQATKDELAETNKTLAAQGEKLAAQSETLAALKAGQEAQGEKLAAQGETLAALKAGQEAQGETLAAQGEMLAAQGEKLAAQGETLAALKAGQKAQEKQGDAQGKRMDSLVTTIRWGFGLLVTAVMLMSLQWNRMYADMNQRYINLVEKVIANTATKPVAVASPPLATTAVDGAGLDAGESPAVVGADGAAEADAGAAGKPVATVVPPATAAVDGAGLDAGESPAVVGADGAAETDAGGAGKPVAGADDAAEAESSTGAATSVAAQR